MDLEKLVDYISKITNDYKCDDLNNGDISEDEALIHGYFHISSLLMEDFLSLNKENITVVDFKRYKGELRIEFGSEKYQLNFSMQKSKKIVEGDKVKFILNDVLSRKHQKKSVDLIGFDKIEKIISLYSVYQDIMREYLFLYNKNESHDFVFTVLSEKNKQVESRMHYQNSFRNQMKSNNHIKYGKSFPSRLERVFLDESIGNIGLKKENHFKI